MRIKPDRDVALGVHLNGDLIDHDLHGRVARVALWVMPMAHANECITPLTKVLECSGGKRGLSALWSEWRQLSTIG